MRDLKKEYKDELRNFLNKKYEEVLRIINGDVNFDEDKLEVLKTEIRDILNLDS